MLYVGQALLFTATSAGLVLFALGSGASALGLAGVLTFALFVLGSGITMAAGKTTVSTPAL